MIEKAKAVLAATMLAACVVVATANRADAQTQPRSARAMTIAGVRLGMTEAEAISVLKRDGWTLKSEAGSTWDEAVAVEVRRQRSDYGTSGRGSAIGSWLAVKGDEAVSVSLKPTPNGGIVDHVGYSAHMPDAPLPTSSSS